MGARCAKGRSAEPFTADALYAGCPGSDASEPERVWAPTLHWLLEGDYARE